MLIRLAAYHWTNAYSHETWRWPGASGLQRLLLLWQTSRGIRRGGEGGAGRPNKPAQEGSQNPQLFGIEDFSTG